MQTGWKYIDAAGLKFAYLEEGSGPLVLLVHGFPDTAHTWDAVRPALAKAGYRAVSVNTRGYWPSEIPADGNYQTARLARDVLELIAAFGEKSALVIGHDWGASAAYGAANLSPERVSFLVTVAIPHPASLLRPNLRLLWGGRHFLSFRFKRADAQLRANNFQLVDELVQRWSPAWKIPPGETAPIKEALSHAGCVEAALGYYRAITIPPDRSQMDSIRVPSVAFSGSEDGVTIPADFDFARRYYKAPYQIINMPGGHFLHREHPARFIEELLRVLPARTP